MQPLTFTFLAAFCGIGPGALGFLRAAVRLLGTEGRFVCLGDIDVDPLACIDFERLTKALAWCIDVRDITPEELRERYGEDAPDVVFGSPPCQGASRLLSTKKSEEQHYQDLNELTEVWVEKMLAAWPTRPPKLVLIENVPGLPTRAKAMLARVRKMLRAHGYVFHASTHDCGEIGGLAQHRQRYLLVARHQATCPPLLYQPPKRRVRGVGEVLETLPMPATEAAKVWGELHAMPRLAWRNWLRLALIPAGGDWRDLDGVLKEGQARREVFRRHAVQRWDEPHPAVTGPGGHSVEAVADPRIAVPEGTAWHRGIYGVNAWTEPTGVISGGADNPSRGTFSVADPRNRALVADVRTLTIEEALAIDLDPKRPPPFTPVIVAEDGTWHRPMTLLELAALQGIPSTLDGQPLKLAGTRTQIATHVGNAVPVGAAEAIGERMLVALVEGALGTMSLGGGNVWVDPHATGALS